MYCSAWHIFWALFYHPCSWNFYVFSCSPKQRNLSGLIGSVALESFPSCNMLCSRKSWKVMGFTKKHLCCCAGFDWHKVNFLHSSCCLCFAFVIQRVFIIQGCFHYYWSGLTQSQGLFCLSLHLKKRLWGPKGLGGDSQLQLAHGSSIPCGLMLSL